MVWRLAQAGNLDESMVVLTPIGMEWNTAGATAWLLRIGRSVHWHTFFCDEAEACQGLGFPHSQCAACQWLGTQLYSTVFPLGF